MSDVDRVRAETRAAVEQAADPAALEAVRVAVLGRKGTLTDLMKNLGTMAPEERRAYGAAVNALKDELTALIETRRAALGDAALAELCHLGMELGMDVLVEVHDLDELERALQVPAPLLGVNNRNLRTFEVSLDTTLALKQAVPPDRLLVTESGIHRPEDVALMRANGVDAFLVGERCMRAADPGEELARLFGN